MVEYLRKIGTIGTMDIPTTNQPLQQGLEILRGYVNAIDPAVILWGLWVTACAIILARRSAEPVIYQPSRKRGGRVTN